MDHKFSIVLLPGMEGTGELFQWLTPRLNSSVESIVVSYPAHELLTYQQLVDYVAERLPDKPFALLAESFSGPIAAMLAARKPHNLRGILFVASFVASPVADWIRFIPLRRMFSLNPPKSILKWLLLDKHCDRIVSAEVQRVISSISPEVMEGRVKEILAVNAGDDLSSSGIPFVSIYASDDRLIGLQGNDTIQRVGSNAEAVMIEGPHLLAQSRPNEVAHVVNQYIERWSAT